MRTYYLKTASILGQKYNIFRRGNYFCITYMIIKYYLLMAYGIFYNIFICLEPKFKHFLYNYGMKNEFTVMILSETYSYSNYIFNDGNGH